MKLIPYKDISDLKQTFNTYSEHRLRNLFDPGEAQEIARFLLNESAHSEITAIEILKQHFNSRDSGMELPGMKCNCPEPADTRWHKADDGTPITLAYDPRSQPIQAGRLLRQAFQSIQSVCGIKFQWSASRDADIYIGWDELDGKGNTLEITYVPASGDRLEACGPLCGDILFDMAEYWGKNQLFRTVALHAGCHAVGVGHNQTDPDSLMYPYVQKPKEITPDVIQELITRYPL